ncbi:MAG: hypothetical protein SZ59_C0001G0040 [candidate division TM6 bacterium GW2011_GWF2_28_16]|nr:MAG: hypothetical protein SZ59_C0001G0040 [candidate division TM6 bacterium GW2011_GWF2_28_16]
MKRVNIIVLFLLIIMSANTNALLAKNRASKQQKTDQEAESRLAKFKTSFVDFINRLPEMAKAKLDSLNYDELEELNFTFPVKVGEKEFNFGFRWNWEAGAGDVGTGFTKFKGELVSPTLGELNILPTETPNNILRIHLLNVLLGIGSKTERDVAKSDVIKNIADPLRKAIGPDLLKKLNDILELKPLYIFYIKLILLAKTYIPSQVEEIPNQVMFLLMRLMQTVNVEKTIEANNGEKNSKKWTKRIYYDDPVVLLKALPDFIKNTLNDIKIPVQANSYQEWKDKKTGYTNYDKQISEVMRRGSIDSEVKYAKENLQSLFENENLTLTDAKMLAYLCARFVYNKDLSKNVDALNNLIINFVDEVLNTIKNINTSDKFTNKEKDLLVKKLNDLKDILDNDGELKQEPVLDDFAIFEKQNISIMESLTYYLYLLKNNMGYKFYGDNGYVYSDAILGDAYTLSYATKVAFRVFKDLRIALKQAQNLVPDIKDQGVEIGKQAYQEIVGASGTFDAAGNVVIDGAGMLFEQQKADAEYKKAVSMLKQAKEQLAPNDPRLQDYLNQKSETFKNLVIAKKNLVQAKTNFAIKVLRHFKFKRAVELEPETEMQFILREFKRLGNRSKVLQPVIENINKFAKSLIGFEFISLQDLEKEPEFDETIFIEEEDFSYDDEPVDVF